MTKTELAMLLARERVKAQAELLAQAPDLNPELAAMLKGANLYDHALTEAMAQIQAVKAPVRDHDTCWFCGERNFYPTAFDIDCHPFYLCMSCGATTMATERYPVKAKRLALPYRKLANEVARLVGDARKARLPAGYCQNALPERC
jgi:hypothetical protein